MVTRVDNRFEQLSLLRPASEPREVCEAAFRQTLGLPYNKEYDYLVAYDVCLDDIVRPCRFFTSTPALPSEACACAEMTTGPEDYRTFYDTQLQTDQFPFTGQGYTFDW